MALKFKAGYRRVNNSAHPSTYQMNYSWKEPQPSAAPLLEAANLLQRAGQPSNPSRIVVSSEHTHDPACPVHRDAPTDGAKRYVHGSGDTKENVKPGGGAPEGRKRPLMEPLAIPGSTDPSDRGNKAPAEPIRTRDTAGSRVRAGNGLKLHGGGGLPVHKRKPDSPPKGGGVKKKRKYSSPLKRLYESDYRRQGLAKAQFQTQYQMQYKDWLQETEGDVGWRGKSKERNK